MRHTPLPLSNGLMSRSRFETNFLRVDLCCEVRSGLVAHGGGLWIRFWVCSSNSVSLVEFGSGAVQVTGLQYVRRLVVRGWFLKWNCFFIVCVRRLADFRTRWRVEAGSVGTKFRPKVSTLVSVENSWWEERFLMALFLKFIWSSWRIRRLVFLKFLAVCVCGRSFLNEAMEYCCLGCAVLVNFLERFLRFLLMYALKRRREYLVEKQIFTFCLVEAIGLRVSGR